MSGYFRAKAELLLDKSPEIYRKGDFFSHPPEKMSAQEKKGLLFAASQVAEGLGFSPDKPIQEVALNHLIMLAHCFHFKELKVNSHQIPESPFVSDKIRIKHVITGEEETLYLHTTPDLPRSRRKRRLPVFQKIGPDYLPRIGYYPSVLESKLTEKGQIGEYSYEVHTDCTTTGSRYDDPS
jgi:hypothetical protein